MKTRKKLLVLLLVICAVTILSIFSFAACSDNKEKANTKLAPVAGHFELCDIPFQYNNMFITKYDYDFYLDGRVVTTIYAATTNYADVFHNYGNYIWYEGSDLITIKWNGSDEVIDLLYTDEYVSNGLFNAYFKCANDSGQVAGKIVSVSYSTNTRLKYKLDTVVGGTIVNGDEVQYIKKGGDALTVTAVANDGFEFTGWSDGVTNAERQDTHISSNLSVKANFKQVKEIYKFEFSASDGGTLSGATYQEVVEGKNISAVTAIPDEGNDEYGYEFIGWSDGVTEIERTDVSSENVSTKALFAQVGTAENPYKISTVQDLRNMEKHPKASYVLNADLVFSGSENFIPLFSEENPFLGTFDGQGHTIENLKIYNPNDGYCGLFAYIGRLYYFEEVWGTVKNLTLKNVDISGGGYVGGVAGFSKGVVENCNVSGKIKIITSGTVAGGLVGGENSDMINCTADINISNSIGSSAIAVGGVAGILSGNASDCTASVVINIPYGGSVGGVFGEAWEGVYTNLSSSGNITLSSLKDGNYHVGGVVGYIRGQMTAQYHSVISDSRSSCNICISSESVDASKNNVHCGGIVGYISNSNGYPTDYIEKCYATGDITASGGTVYCGGLAGLIKSDITTCFATGNITVSAASVCVGGLLGYGSQTITASYSTGCCTVNASEEVIVGGIVGFHYGEVANCYTVSKIKDESFNTISDSNIGGVAGRVVYSSDHPNTYWLYYSSAPLENAVGEHLNSYGKKTKDIKCTQLSEFKNLADKLNDGLDKPVWENTQSLPKLSFSPSPDVPDTTVGS